MQKRWRVTRLTGWRPGRLAKNTAILTGGFLVRAACQAILLVLVTRALGPQSYGAFIAALALTSVLSPLVGCGTAILLVREVARRPTEFSFYFGRGLIATGCTAVPLIALVLAITGLFLPAAISRTTLLFLALAEMLFIPVIDLTARAYQAFERLDRMAFILTEVIVMRLLGFTALLGMEQQISPELWAVYYLVFTGLGVVLGVGLLMVDFGPPRWTVKNLYQTLREGFYFALGASSIRVNADIDKTLVASLDNLAAAGAYSAAYRFVDILTLPIIAFTEAAYARFFRAGQGGVEPTRALAVRLLPVPLGYSLAIGGLLWLAADFILWLLGPDYAESAVIARWLIWLPAVLLIHHLLRLIVLGAGRQRLNGGVESLGACANIGLNIGLIPGYGWKGAILASLLAEALMITSLLVLLPRAGPSRLRDGS